MLLILITIGGIAIVALWWAMETSHGRYSYRFEEKTVRARYLEEARGKLNEYRSPLIETDDPCIL